MTTVTPKTDFYELLCDIQDFLDNYVDVNDGDDGQPVPNKAMRLYSRVVTALNELEGIAPPYA